MKKILTIILVLLLLLMPVSASAATELPLSKGDSGDDVVRLQLRLLDLGYVAFRATGKYGDMTQTGISAFQTRSKLKSDGVTGEDVWDALFETGAPRAAINPKLSRVFGPGQTKISENKGERTPWSEVSALIPVGTQFELIDYNTSTAFSVIRTGGSNHADVEPADEEAFKGYKTAFGGGFSWEKRAFVAKIGERYIAASLFGMPNATDVVPANGTTGGLCLYFTDCTSDIGLLPDAEHAANILKAAGDPA